MKILITDRSYSNFSVFDDNNIENTTVEINPIQLKLFDGDIFLYKQNTEKI